MLSVNNRRSFDVVSSSLRVTREKTYRRSCGFVCFSFVMLRLLNIMFDTGLKIMNKLFNVESCFRVRVES
jgi:hypothetical protein